MNRLYNLFAKIIILNNQPYLKNLNSGLLFTNWFFQKILKINGGIPFQIHYTSKLTGSNNIKIIGKSDSILTSFAISGGCYYGISSNSVLEIGEGTIWAYNLNIQTANHNPINLNEFTEQNIKIGKQCWIGGNVSILAGVTLGNNVVVGANTVVTKSFPDNVIIAGCPAKIIRQLEA